MPNTPPEQKPRPAPAVPPIPPPATSTPPPEENPAEQIDALTKEHAKQLAAAAEDLAEARRQYATMKEDYEIRTAELRSELATQKQTSAALFAEKLAEKDAEIAALKAAQKSAELIAAERYGAGVTNTPAAPGVVADAEALQRQWDTVKKAPAKQSAFFSALTQAQRKLFENGTIK